MLFYERYDADRNFKTQYWPYGNQGLGMQNPYWIINRNMFNTDRDRYIISLSMKWNITNWLNIIGRARIDNAYTVSNVNCMHLQMGYSQNLKEII